MIELLPLSAALYVAQAVSPFASASHPAIVGKVAVGGLLKMKQNVDLKSKLKEFFGYDQFRHNQEDIIKSVLAGTDVLALMPTGGGKSLCYQLPGLFLEGVALVISPLISLMQDQVYNLRQHGLSAHFWNSTLNIREKQELEEKLNKGEVNFLYLAPEAILNPSILQFLQKLKVSLIAIDEAHCVSQWGHEFRKDYMRLHELKTAFPEVPTLALTATADRKTQTDICEQLKLKNPEKYVSSFDRPNIKYAIEERKNELSQLKQFLQQRDSVDTGIVYCLSRKKVERIAEELQDWGYNAVAYHAGLPAEVREQNQERFNTEEGLIVVATIAFGMGIDRPDVRFVAHLDLPKSLEGYYQETGRAGRDGEASDAWMLYGLSDVVKLSQMIERTDASEAYKKVARHKLDYMLSLCETGTCRRQFLLKYFDENLASPCGHCDTCLNPPETWDGTREAQMFLSAVYRTDQVFGASHIIDVLRGSENEKVLSRGHDKLSVSGIGKSLSKSEWNSIARQLLTAGFLRIKNWDYKNLALTEKSRPLLRGEESIHFRKLKDNTSARSSSRKSKAFDHDRPDLFEALRGLRTELAKENKVPPYMVFSDKTLHDMCVLLPQTSDDMLMVHGVGETKMDRFGNEFISIIKELA